MLKVPTGYVYQGQFLGDLSHGMGKCVFPDGVQVLSGRWEHGDLVYAKIANAKGVLIYHGPMRNSFPRFLSLAGLYYLPRTLILILLGIINPTD